jgi:hypothetical protein
VESCGGAQRLAAPIPDCSHGATHNSGEGERRPAARHSGQQHPRGRSECGCHLGMLSTAGAGSEAAGAGSTHGGRGSGLPADEPERASRPLAISVINDSVDYYD